MKRTIVAIACAIGCFYVGNAHNVNSLLPQKREKKKLRWEIVRQSLCMNLCRR